MLLKQRDPFERDACAKLIRIHLKNHPIPSTEPSSLWSHSEQHLTFVINVRFEGGVGEGVVMHHVKEVGERQFFVQHELDAGDRGEVKVPAFERKVHIGTAFCMPHRTGAENDRLLDFRKGGQGLDDQVRVSLGQSEPHSNSESGLI